MYRIELSPGEETVFRSIEELAVAIKRGVVTPRARIWHNASSKWLPVQFHPHYKTALSMPLTQSKLVAGPSVKPLSGLSLGSAPAPEPPAPAPEPAASSLPLPAPLAAAARALTGEPKPAVEPKAAPEEPRKKKAKQKPAAEKRSRSQGKQGRQLRIALIAALLLGGAQWVLSEPLISRTNVAALFRTHRRLVVTSANTAAMVPVISAEEKPAAAASFGGRAKARLVPVAPVAAPTVDTEVTEPVEPAPSGIDMSAPRAPAMDALARTQNDSTDQRAIKGILRAVSGTSTKAAAPRRSR